jgi:TetR/AcrR family transcriptional repressor of nem operon
MSESSVAILDAAERRIRLGGFHGFSFREIAADVGIKSSSVHYYFPTKENLAAAVSQRYTERIEALIDGQLASGAEPAEIWVQAFRGTLLSTDRMCPCTVLAAASRDLPPQVLSGVQDFFKMCLSKLTATGFSSDQAADFLATITGAMVMANSLDDVKVYDRATRGLAEQFKLAAR